MAWFIVPGVWSAREKKYNCTGWLWPRPLRAVPQTLGKLLQGPRERGNLTKWPCQPCTRAPATWLSHIRPLLSCPWPPPARVFSLSLSQPHLRQHFCQNAQKLSRWGQALPHLPGLSVLFSHPLPHLKDSGWEQEVWVPCPPLSLCVQHNTQEMFTEWIVNMR